MRGQSTGKGVYFNSNDSGRWRYFSV